MNSHDVRRLHTCVLCDKVGIYQPTDADIDVPIVVCVHSTRERPLTVKKKQRSFCHPRCYVKRMSVAKLLSLHNDELSHVRMNDVPPYIMRMLLARMRKG